MQAVRALWICTRLLSRKPTEAIPNAEGRRAVESNAYIGVTNPFTPTTPSRTSYRSRRHFYKLINAAAHSLRRSGSSPQSLTTLWGPLFAPFWLAAICFKTVCKSRLRFTNMRLKLFEPTEAIRNAEERRKASFNAYFAVAPSPQKALRLFGDPFYKHLTGAFLFG